MENQSKFEPILEESGRLGLYPLRYPDLWKLYQDHISTFWTASEIDLSNDINDWENKLTEDERHYIENVLGFFAMSDFLVNENISKNYMGNIKILELEFYYRFQMMMEDIHSTVYADMINAFVKDADKKKLLIEATETIPVIKKKAEWARKYINDLDGMDGVEKFVTRLVAFSIVEGVFFSGSFCSIFWLKKRGLMPGLTLSNELISKDEGLHRDVACYVYKNIIVNKLPEERVIKILTDAVELEKEFVQEALNINLIGMNSKLMSEYIEYVADHLLVNLIGKRHFHTQNPFDWMVMISLPNKANFFETRVTEYSKATNGNIVFNEDF